MLSSFKNIQYRTFCLKKKKDLCMPSQTLTSMGLLWRCYTMEMASFTLTQMTPSAPDQPIRGDLLHHSVSANHIDLRFLRQSQHPLIQLITVEPHKYDPLSKSSQSEINFGKSQNGIQILVQACLRIRSVTLMKYRTGPSNL